MATWMECYPQNGKRYPETQYVGILGKSWVVLVEPEWAWLRPLHTSYLGLEAAAVTCRASPQRAGAGLERWTGEQMKI